MLIIIDGAHQIDRIEVSTLIEHPHIVGVRLVYLRAFQYLKAHRAIGIVGKERTATRLTTVSYHTADTHRTIELGQQISRQLLVVERCRRRIATTQRRLKETEHLKQLASVRLAGRQTLDKVESMILKRNQDAGNSLLPLGSGWFQFVGNNIVDILDEYHICMNIIEILYQCSMTCLLYTSPSPRDGLLSRMPSSA